MPRAETCGWSGCKAKATTEVALDAGSAPCKECGQEVTNRRVYALCADHESQYADAGDVTQLLLHALAREDA